MAVRHGIWKIGGKPQTLATVKLEREYLLEDQITKDISILSDHWLLIGRQVYTDFGKYIDLLAIDATGSIIIIELKKHKTPRDVVAQTIDYAAWVENLSSEKFVQIYADFAANHRLPDLTFDQAFKAKFGAAAGTARYCLNTACWLFINQSRTIGCSRSLLPDLKVRISPSYRLLLAQRWA